MDTPRSRFLLAGLLVGTIAAGCANPRPSASPVMPSASPPPSVSATPTPSATPSPTAPPVSVAPRVVCQPNGFTGTRTDANGSAVPIVITLTCENAVAAARAAVGPDPSVAYIEFGYGSWCPPGAFCALALPNTGHVVFHRKGRLPDLLVAVSADEAGTVTASAPIPLPSPLPG